MKKDELYTVNEKGIIDPTDMVRELVDGWLALLANQGFDEVEKMLGRPLTGTDLLSVTAYAMALSGIQLGVMAERNPEKVEAIFMSPTLH
jgi:hypothetical protein